MMDSLMAVPEKPSKPIEASEAHTRSLESPEQKKLDNIEFDKTSNVDTGGIQGSNTKDNQNNPTFSCEGNTISILGLDFSPFGFAASMVVLFFIIRGRQK